MPKSYWTYVFATATHLINRMPTPVLDMDTPFHKLFGTQPNYTKLRVFGCLCFPRLRPYTKHKLEDRSTPCVLLGYSTTQSAYLCLQPATGRIYVSRHVRFDETKYPFNELRMPTQTPIPELLSQPTSPPVTTIPIPTTSPNPPQPTQPGPPLTQSQMGSSSSDSDLQVQESSTDLESTTPTSGGSEAPATNVNSASTAQPSNQQGQQQQMTSSSSSSASEPPPPPPANNHPMQTRCKNQIIKPNPKYNYSAALSASIPEEPHTLAQALRDKRWSGSMSTEIEAFSRNGTYDLVPRQPHYNVVGCRWLHKNKFNSNGTHR